MTKRQTRILTGVLLAASILPFPVMGQTVGSPQSVEEQKPTPRDPRYTAPMVPPYLRDLEADDATQLLLNPDAIREQSETYTDVEERRREEIRTMNRLELDGDRKYLEDRYLEQYGMDSYDYRYTYSETYQEDGWRRVQITFFLSLPITAGFSYGAMSLAKQSSGESNKFTGPQTAALAGLSILFSGLISWYDYENWMDWKKENELSYLLPAPERRSGKKASKETSESYVTNQAGTLHPIWIGPAHYDSGLFSAPSPGGARDYGSPGLGFSWRF